MRRAEQRLRTLEARATQSTGCALLVFLYDQSGAYYQRLTTGELRHYTEAEIEQLAGGHKVILLPDNGRDWT